jgi:hypothetical protein
MVETIRASVNAARIRRTISQAIWTAGRLDKNEASYIFKDFKKVLIRAKRKVVQRDFRMSIRAKQGRSLETARPVTARGAFGVDRYDADVFHRRENPIVEHFFRSLLWLR